MSPVALKDLREDVKNFIDHADEKVLRMVYAMLEVDADNVREESIERGLAQSKKRIVKPHEQVMSEIRKRYKA
jgi:hypothetical protein